MTATIKLPLSAKAGPDGQWQEPSPQRRDKWPPYIRRQSWVIQDISAGTYFGRGGDSWVGKAEEAFSCMWFKRAAELVTSAPNLFPNPEQLRLVLVTFYCDPKTFPLGWFADE